MFNVKIFTNNTALNKGNSTPIVVVTVVLLAIMVVLGLYFYKNNTNQGNNPAESGSSGVQMNQGNGSAGGPSNAGGVRPGFEIPPILDGAELNIEGEGVSSTTINVTEDSAVSGASINSQNNNLDATLNSDENASSSVNIPDLEDDLDPSQHTPGF